MTADRVRWPPQVRNEIAVLKKVSMGHQNILTLVDYFETMNNCQYTVRIKVNGPQLKPCSISRH